MKNFNFKSYLTSNISDDKINLDKIVSNCQLKAYKKGDYLLQPGEKCIYSFFVEEGLLRMYSIDKKGKEHIIQFAPENWFVTDRESVFFKNPSNYFIQAIEDTEVLLITEEFMLNLEKSDDAFLAFNNKLLQNHIRNLQNRIVQLLGATAEERYLDFIRIYPDILLRVPQIMVASYLGITPESLSRIRKDLAKKNCH